MSLEKKTYKDAASFAQALKNRLVSIAKQKNIDLERLRKQVAFDRFLARIFGGDDRQHWFLKGGYAMELRFHSAARTTKDVDITIPDMSWSEEGRSRLLDTIRERLQELCFRKVDDWFGFTVGAPIMDLDTAPYGGGRFPVEVSLAAKKFTSFHLDVGVGDAVIFAPEWREDLKAFHFVSRRYRNRRIGEFLKELDMTEGRGTGIPKMLRAVKANESPEPVFHTDLERTFFMAEFPIHPAFLGERLESQDLRPESGPESGPESILDRVIYALKGRVLSKSELAKALGQKAVSSKLNLRIREMLSKSWIEMTIPEKPNSRLQKYRLTSKGSALLEAMEKNS